MASPTVDLCSSENSLSEDTAQELTTRASVPKEKSSAAKNDVTKSPTPDSKAKGFQNKKGVSLKTGGGAWSEDGTEPGGQQQQQQQGTGRKKRARATPAEDAETNGRKSATDSCGRESSLWPGADGEGPVQGSLLEEVLAEKRMALMRSPEVLRFLQQRQTAVRAAQQHAAVLEAQAADFSIGEVEEDANS